MFTFVVISPPKVEISTRLKCDNLIELPILSDIGNNVIQHYGLVFTLPEHVRKLYKNFGAYLPQFNDDNNYRLRISATYLVGQGKKIIFSYTNVNYMEMVE